MRPCRLQSATEPSNRTDASSRPPIAATHKLLSPVHSTPRTDRNSGSPLPQTARGAEVLAYWTRYIGEGSHQAIHDDQGTAEIRRVRVDPALSRRDGALDTTHSDHPSRSPRLIRIHRAPQSGAHICDQHRRFPRSIQVEPFRDGRVSAQIPTFTRVPAIDNTTAQLPPSVE